MLLLITGEFGSEVVRSMHLFAHSCIARAGFSAKHTEPGRSLHSRLEAISEAFLSRGGVLSHQELFSELCDYDEEAAGYQGTQRRRIAEVDQPPFSFLSSSQRLSLHSDGLQPSSDGRHLHGSLEV